VNVARARALGQAVTHEHKPEVLRQLVAHSVAEYRALLTEK